MKRVYVAEKHYKSLSRDHQHLIPHFPGHCKKLRACIDHNYQIIKLILQNVEDMFENKDNEAFGVIYLSLKYSKVEKYITENLMQSF